MNLCISEHCSTAAVDHLGELIKSLDSTSSAIGKISLHRTKCSRLQKYVLAPAMMKKLREDIGTSYFSLILDESTNTSNIQCLGVVIRYFSSVKHSIVDTLYRLVSIESATAQAIFDKLISLLVKDDLSVSKLVGIGCDGANTMVGRHNSVATLLQEKQPLLVVFRCVCHSLHLAAAGLLPAALGVFSS